ncbi:MAG: hypothetical protein JW837_13465 [Sedimentisphaerales bacterium]|nr:hypothetical protein [Sedimentisphaerales bacterium]
MKKTAFFVLLATVFCFSAQTSFGIVVNLTPPPSPSLGGWYEGDAGTTHQMWDFTPGYISGGAGYTAVPEEVSNPDPMFVLATISTDGAWDQETAIVGSWIYVNLEIPNYKVLNPYKEIWVDIGNATIAPDSIALSAAGHGINTTDYRYEVLQGKGDAEFGVKIWPNPEIEKIGFMIIGATAPTGATAPAMLDYIHVDTICIPEPATVCLLAMGSLILIRRKYKEI